MVANTWIAAAPGDWSDDANWSLGHSPIAGEDPTFDGTSVNNCAANDDTPTGVLTIAAGYTGTIAESSDMYISGYSQAGGIFTGITTKWVYCSGNFIKTSGTFTSAKSKLNLTGTGTIRIATAYAENLYALTISSSGNYSTTNPIFVVNPADNFLMINGKLSTTSILYVYPSGTSSHFIGNGELSGSGTFEMICYAGTGYRDITFKTDINIKYAAQGTDGANHIIQLQRPLNCKGISFSVPGTRIFTLDLNGRSLTASTIAVGTRGILTNSAATTSLIRCNSFDSSAGTYTPDRTVLVMEGASTLKLAAGGSVNSLISKGVTALASDAIVANVCAHVNPITKGAFALTLTKPENEYTGLRRPIIIPVKKLDIGPVGLADGWLRDLGAVV